VRRFTVSKDQPCHGAVPPVFPKSREPRVAVAAQSRKIDAVLEEHVIVIDPDIMNGIPCFRGTRVPFKNLIDYLEGGHSLGELLTQFPTVTRVMAVQSLESGLY
jgi:uncharacterized protein (DUF433 family)